MKKTLSRSLITLSALSAAQAMAAEPTVTYRDVTESEKAKSAKFSACLNVYYEDTDYDNDGKIDWSTQQVGGCNETNWNNRPIEKDGCQQGTIKVKTSVKLADCPVPAIL